jgi:hypothetical protein
MLTEHIYTDFRWGRYAAFRLLLGATHAEVPSARRAKPRQGRMYPLLEDV